MKSNTRQTLATGNFTRIEYDTGQVYITLDNVTTQISAEIFFDLAGTTLIAFRNYQTSGPD